MVLASEEGPKVGVQALRRYREAGSGAWLFAWRVENRTDRPLKFLAARCPHGQFKSTERVFNPPLQAEAGRSETIEISVHCDEPVGAVVENAFLILMVEWLEASWRLFVRFRVTIKQQGEPETTTELITSQRVGFSGVD